MYNIFFCSDHHFGHTRLYTEFKLENGHPARNFISSDEADEIMIQRHNSVVRANDRVYFLGDVCFHKKHLYKVGKMTGRKVLIKGNHDLLELKDYAQYFDDIRGVHQFKGVIMSHIPLHEESLARWGFNVHGHLHTNNIKINGVNDKRYLNVSMEQIDYTPISLENVMKYKL